mmetsp:Transcript_21545/g.40888  ORF Transcript_21545/g.40888 Transcript_21545/m.40888 type:complete len:383 (-) Transcript_21545:223-1371(-)
MFVQVDLEVLVIVGVLTSFEYTVADGDVVAKRQRKVPGSVLDSVQVEMVLVELGNGFSDTEGGNFNVRKVILNGGTDMQVKTRAALELVRMNHDQIALAVERAMFAIPTLEVRVSASTSGFGGATESVLAFEGEANVVNTNYRTTRGANAQGNVTNGVHAGRNLDGGADGGRKPQTCRVHFNVAKVFFAVITHEQIFHGRSQVEVVIANTNQDQLIVSQRLDREEIKLERGGCGIVSRCIERLGDFDCIRIKLQVLVACTFATNLTKEPYIGFSGIFKVKRGRRHFGTRDGSRTLVGSRARDFVHVLVSMFGRALFTVPINRGTIRRDKGWIVNVQFNGGGTIHTLRRVVGKFTGTCIGDRRTIISVFLGQVERTNQTQQVI